MKKSLILLLLFVMGLTLCGGQVLAEDGGGEVPDEEIPELYDSSAVAMLEAVNLAEGEDPEEEEIAE